MANVYLFRVLESIGFNHVLVNGKLKVQWHGKDVPEEKKGVTMEAYNMLQKKVAISHSINMLERGGGKNIFEIWKWINIIRSENKGVNRMKLFDLLKLVFIYQTLEKEHGADCRVCSDVRETIDYLLKEVKLNPDFDWRIKHTVRLVFDK